MSQKKKDYYEILGVPRNATKEEIRNAYKKLAIEWHPDKWSGHPQEEINKAEEKFKEINEAHTTLSDKEERAKYDFYRQNSSGFDGFKQTHGFDIEFGGDPSSIFEDILEGFFGDNSSRRKESKGSQHQSRKGDSILVKISLEFKESVFGTTYRTSIELDKACNSENVWKYFLGEKQITEQEKSMLGCNQTGAYSEQSIANCSRCGGKGTVKMFKQAIFLRESNIYTTCPNCEGQGKIITKECVYCSGKKFFKYRQVFSFNIPRNTHRLQIQNVGNDGWYGAEKGDIFLEIKVKDHHYFKREGNDIHVNLPISFLDAILGNEVKVITLEGLETIRVPSTTQNDDCYILENKGCFLSGNRNTRGNFYIHFKIIMPSRVTSSTKEILRKIEQGSNWNPNLNFIKENQEIITK